MHSKQLWSLPLSDKTVFRILVFVVLILSITTGLYAEKLRQQQKLYDRVEDMFVRVRGELGREETQRLIDQSYE